MTLNELIEELLAAQELFKQKNQDPLVLVAGYESGYDKVLVVKTLDVQELS